MTSLHEAIADNLILDPETEEWIGGKGKTYIGCLVHGGYRTDCEVCKELTARAFANRVNKGTGSP